MERIEGWEARTDGPLGPIPFLLGAAVAAVVAIVFTSAVAWVCCAAFVGVLMIRGVRWTMRQVEAVQMDREADQMVAREPRLVPLYHAPHWNERKAS